MAKERTPQENLGGPAGDRVLLWLGPLLLAATPFLLLGLLFLAERWLG